MHSGSSLLLVLLAAILLIVFLIVKVRVHAFLALIAASFVVGVGSGMPLLQIAASFEKGVGGTLGFLAAIIGLGGILGKMLEESGGAERIAQTLLNALGKERASWAMMLVGFIAGIPVFFEVGFVLLIPLIYVVAKETRINLLYLGVPLAVSLMAVHCMLPPHPAAMAITGMLGADVGKVIVYGLIVALPTAIIAGPLWIKLVCKPQAPAAQEAFLDEHCEGRESRDLPSLGLTLLTILLPLLLMVGKSFAASLPPDSAAFRVVSFLGTPLIALSIAVQDIGIPADAKKYIGPGEYVYYPVRQKDSHKGESGKLLIVGGGPFTGAPALAGLAAYRMGVDLVNIATPWMSYGPIASYSPNLIVHRLSGDVLGMGDVPTIKDLMRGADALLIGPGLGVDDNTQKAVREIVKACTLPLVIDADGITAVAKEVSVLQGKKCVITPHSREYQTLVGHELPKELDARMADVAESARGLGVVLLVKGMIDVVSDGAWTKLNRTGNAGMSVGGTGDTLAGEVAALLSKHVSAFNSARIAAYSNGAAGDLVFDRIGYGLMATDVIDSLPEVLRRSLKKVN